MKALASLLAVFACGAGAAPDTPARLGLWVTEPIGASNGAHCVLGAAKGAARIAGVEPTLTEKDVIAWRQDGARWRLDQRRFSSDQSMQLRDHCFVLAIDGQVISSGLVLASYSARLTDLPTLRVSRRDGVIELQLTAGYGAGEPWPLHRDLLDAVLSRRNEAGRDAEGVR